MEVEKYISEEEIINITKDLLIIESHRDADKQEYEVAQYIGDKLKSEGIKTVLEEVEPDRPNVYAYLEGKNEEVELLFNGHIDTIPPFSMNYDPFSPFINNGYIYGRGAADMKSAIAAMMSAFIAIKREGLDLSKTCKFSGVIDEEQNSKGTERVIKNGKKVNKAIIGEPTELKVCTGHKGMDWMAVKFIGSATHGSRPEEGINAIYMAAELCDYINNDLQKEIKNRVYDFLGAGSVNVGRIYGGDGPNVVPDSCVVEIDRRWLPQETSESICEEIEVISEKIAYKYGGTFEMDMMKEYEAELINRPFQIDPEKELVKRMVGIVENTTKEEYEETAFPAWSDAGLLSHHLGCDCIVLGPGNINQAHANDEHCSIEQIIQATEIYYQAIKEFCL